jgi:CHAD domain-containing protein
MKATPRAKPKLGLRAWMERVPVECDRAAAGFEADPVHDLRVALRRCRSLADGIMAMDPDSSWKEMKKAGRKLFQALGSLRDMHVMQEWISKIGEADDPVTPALLTEVRLREAHAQHEALQALDQFDRKKWRQWSRSLPRRAARVRRGSVVFQHLALEKWHAAYDLHKRAMRTRSQLALHELRIGIKRFRYTVENFLPSLHHQWGNDLKELQDLLGEVHDLDVLWGLALETGAFPNLEHRARWRELIDAQRRKRVERYREMMLGPHSLWHVWRAKLPAGPQVRAAALHRMKVWAAFLDPDFEHSQRVEHLALQLYDGLQQAGQIAPPADMDARAVLQAAALLHDVGKAKGAEDHHKDSFRMIRNLARPMGWNARELELIAVVARYHRGALPRTARKSLQALELPDRRAAIQLAGVLRLANALDPRNGTTPKLRVEARDQIVVVQSAGYLPMDRSAEEVAAARHLLETVLRRPVMVRALRESNARNPGVTR